VGQREEFMAQKFTSLEEAADQLSVSRDRLNQLREAGKVRAYRDGASWKFRSEDVDKLARDGIPPLDAPPSDIGLESDSGIAQGSAASGLDLDLAEDASASGPPSDISLEDVDEPTVAGLDDDESNALAIDLDENPINLSDSILLSEAELGESPGRPPSTIIGKSELDLDADLDLTEAPSGAGAASDVKLAPASDILPAGEDLGLEPPSPSGNFAGLEELEVDLEAESSRILSPDDVAKAKSAAAAAKASESSELRLAPTDSDPGHGKSDIGLAGDAASGAGLTGLSALELEDDDEGVLGDGSDVTLSGESSGINIISPSDSGLALDEVSLDLSGSTPIGSSLDLGNLSADDMPMEPLSVGSDVGQSKAGDFQLTPLGEEDADEEKDSSQVIALDELSEEGAAAKSAVGFGDSGMLTEDFGVGLAPGAVVVSDAADTQFSLWNVLGLGSCILLLSFCCMIVYDLLRNMWSWDGVSSANSSLLEVLNPFL
jgi:excisionase family DNA binding protein